LIDVHEVFDIRQSVFNTVYSVRCLSCLRVKGSFQEAALIIFPSTPIKNTEDGMKKWLKRAKRGICFGPQMDVHYSYVFCAIVYKIGHPLYVKNRCISYIHWTSIVVFAALVWTS
ncbi:hypothetical protein NQ317_005888, partial [Molorchus minor]